LPEASSIAGKVLISKSIVLVCAGFPDFAASI
jgi:hypothetical protein